MFKFSTYLCEGIDSFDKISEKKIEITRMHQLASKLLELRDHAIPGNKKCYGEKKKLLTSSRFNLAFSSKNIQNRPIIQSKHKSKLITISRALKRCPKPMRKRAEIIPEEDK